LAVVIHCQGGHEVLEEETGKPFSLERLQELVGGYIETIPLDKDTILVVNEEGKLKGLPVNMSATEVLQMYRGIGCTVIVGEAVMLALPEEFPNESIN
jgi:hypothetical protein